MSRKFLITIILILFLLPFVSWYYLQSGLEWRKEAQKVMDGTTPFPEGEFSDRNDRRFDADSLSYRVSIVSFTDCHQQDDRAKVLEDIYQQFKDTRKANFIVVDSCAKQGPEADREKWYSFSCLASPGLCQSLLREWPTDKAFALVDRKGIIRSYYSINTEDEKRILVEHMSLLLPRDRQEKVELKRGKKK